MTHAISSIPVAVPDSRYATAAARRVFFAEALGRLAELPGVQRVSAVNRVPLAGSNVYVGMEIEGQPSAGEPPAMDRRVSFPGY